MEASVSSTGTDAPLLERVGPETWKVNVEELKKVAKKNPEELKKMKSKVRRYYKRQNELLTNFEEMELVGRPHNEADMQRERDAEEARDIRVKIAIYGSLGANIVLFCLNIFNAVTSSSYSVLAAALDSFLDIFSGFILWLCSFAVDRTTQRQYPGGKSRFEPLGVIIFSACMFTATFQLLTEAGKTLVSGNSKPDITRQSLILIMAAIGTKLGLFLYCRTISGSTVVRTLAMDHRNDIIMNSFGTLCALGGFYFKWWLDPGGAVLIGVYIMTVWARNGWEQVRKLSGRTADHEFLQALTYLTWNLSTHSED